MTTVVRLHPSEVPFFTSPTRSSGNARPLLGSTTSRSSPLTRPGYPQPTSLHDAKDEGDDDAAVDEAAFSASSFTCGRKCGRRSDA